MKNASQRDQDIAQKLQAAISKLNHLTSLIRDVQKEVEKCEQSINALSQQLKEKHNEHGYN